MKQEQKVNNGIYRSLGNSWWDDDVGEFSTIRFWTYMGCAVRKAG